MKKHILFLCTGNSVRSQMAEGLARALHGDVVEPVSAGSHPCGFVHPLAIQAMREIGIDIAGASSKSADPFLDQPFDVVVTVCDSAAQACPIWFGAKRIEHWPIVDPTFSAGPTDSRLQKFIETREELARRIEQLVAELA